MDISCCKITFLLFIYIILMVVRPSTSCNVSFEYCFTQIYEVFRTAHSYSGDNVQKLFNYAVFNLRIPTTEEKEEYIQKMVSNSQEYSELPKNNENNENEGSSSQGGSKYPLLFDGNKAEDNVWNDVSSFLYYQSLARSSIVDGSVPLPTDYCNKSDDKTACKDSLKYYGFTAENGADIIKHAYFEIVLLDTMNALPFGGNKEPPKNPWYTYNYLREIVKNVKVVQTDVYEQLPNYFCEKIKERVEEYYK